MESVNETWKAHRRTGLLPVNVSTDGQIENHRIVYAASVPMSEIMHHIETVSHDFGASLAPLAHDPDLGDAVFGNLAADIHRDGRPFVTFYYGATSGTHGC